MRVSNSQLPSSSSPTISIVVPTYQEADNLENLAIAIDEALSAHHPYELIIADDYFDSQTQTVCEQLAAIYPLVLLTRYDNRGLSAAVIDGIGRAKGEVVVVMDADLSHPPRSIASIVELLLTDQADFVVGSRYVEGGRLDRDWPWWRRLNSLLATIPARYLTPLADPMAGFFGLRRVDMPDSQCLSPIGYKIGMELCVKGNFATHRIKEVPIEFRDRQKGESKMTLREQLNYLRHLRRLYHYRWPRQMEFLQFLVVGGIGLIIDVMIYLFFKSLGVPHLLARAIAYWPAVTSNWFINRIMTFKHRPKAPPLRQWGKYVTLNAIGFAINWGSYALLTTTNEFFNQHLLLALFIGVVMSTAFNFITAQKVIFRH